MSDRHLNDPSRPGPRTPTRYLIVFNGLTQTQAFRDGVNWGFLTVFFEFPRLGRGRAPDRLLRITTPSSRCGRNGRAGHRGLHTGRFAQRLAASLFESAHRPLFRATAPRRISTPNRRRFRCARIRSAAGDRATGGVVSPVLIPSHGTALMSAEPAGRAAGSPELVHHAPACGVPGENSASGRVQ